MTQDIILSFPYEDERFSLKGKINNKFAFFLEHREQETLKTYITSWVEFFCFRNKNDVEINSCPIIEVKPEYEMEYISLNIWLISLLSIIEYQLQLTGELLYQKIFPIFNEAITY